MNFYLETYFAVIRDFDDRSSCRNDCRSAFLACSRIYLAQSREAWRGYKYPIRGSNLGGSRERNTDRLLVLSCSLERKKSYGTYGCERTPNMRATHHVRVVAGWLAPHGPIYIGVTRNKRDIIHGDTARAWLRLALPRNELYPSRLIAQWARSRRIDDRDSTRSRELQQLFNRRVRSSSSIEQAPRSIYARRDALILPCCTKYAKVDMSVCRAEHPRAHLVALLSEKIVSKVI